MRPEDVRLKKGMTMAALTTRQRRKETGPQYAARTRAMYERVKESGEDITALRNAYDEAVPFMDYMRGYVSLDEVMASAEREDLFFLPEALEDPKRFGQVLILARFSERIRHNLDPRKRHNASDWSTDVPLLEVLLSRKHEWLLVIGRKHVELLGSLEEMVERAREVLPLEAERRYPERGGQVDSGDTFDHNIPLVITDGLMAYWRQTVNHMRSIHERASTGEEKARTALFEVTDRWTTKGFGRSIQPL